MAASLGCAALMLAAACTAKHGAPAPANPEPTMADPAKAEPTSEPDRSLGQAGLDAADPAPTWKDATTPPPIQGDDQLACSFFWRKSDAHGFRKANERTVAFDDVGVRDFQLRDFDFSVQVGESKGGGRELLVSAKVGHAEISERYDFGAHGGAAHLPDGGHGFTGLRYLTHPKSSAEVQFWCGSYDAKVDVKDEMAAQSAPGPSAPKGSTLECNAAVLDAGGKTLDAKTLDAKTLDPAESPKVRLGDFEIEARYFPGEYDSGGLVFDVSSKDMPRVVHSLYQLNGSDLPANIIASPSFTGVHELKATGSTQRLRYSCRTRSKA